MFREELDKFNVHFLFHQPLGSYFMTGPDGNCDNLAGLKGKKIRSFGADIPKMFEAIGAVPVSVGFGDIYEAVQRGTLDYSFINLGNINAIKVYEPGKYSCGPAMSITGHLLVIGKKTWDSLPADIQQIMTEEGLKAGKAYIEAIDRAEVEAGSACVVFGAGLVGLGAVAGCKLRGAGAIIVVDPSPGRREFARRIGLRPNFLRRSFGLDLRQGEPHRGALP